MNLVKENGKLRVFEKNGYTISIWDGGSIVVKKDDYHLKVDHNARNMKKLNEFFGESKQEDTRQFFRQFNKSASVELEGLKKYDIRVIDDKIVLDTKGSKYKAYRMPKTGTLTLSSTHVDEDEPFKRNTRYVVSENDGRFIFLEELGAVSIEDFFKRYDDPILTCY